MRRPNPSKQVKRSFQYQARQAVKDYQQKQITVEPPVQESYRRNFVGLLIGFWQRAISAFFRRTPGVLTPARTRYVRPTPYPPAPTGDPWQQKQRRQARRRHAYS